MNPKLKESENNSKRHDIKDEDWLDILGNPHRRKILEMLSYRPMYPQLIAKILGITPRAVFKHLEKMKNLGILEYQEQNRQAGGRKLHVYHLPRNAFFSFELSKPSCFRTTYSQRGKIPQTHKTPDSLSKSSFTKLKLTKDMKSDIISGFKDIWTINEDLQDLDIKRLNLMKKRDEVNKKINNHLQNNSLGNMIAFLYRLLVEEFENRSWTRKNIMDILSINYDSADEIIKLLEEEFQVIEFDKSSNPRNPSWKLKDLLKSDDLSYI